MRFHPAAPITPLLLLSLALLSGCAYQRSRTTSRLSVTWVDVDRVAPAVPEADPGSQDPQGPEYPQGPIEANDAVDFSLPVAEIPPANTDSPFRVHLGAGFGGTGFENAAGEDFRGAMVNFRGELLWAPGDWIEFGPRLVIGGRGLEEDDDRFNEFSAFDLFGELVLRTYFGELTEGSLRPYLEGFAGGGLQSGEFERELFTSRGLVLIENSDTGGVFTFGGGAGFEYASPFDDSLFTVGLEVRSVQPNYPDFGDLDQFDVGLVFLWGRGL